jgi:hypothetical protein
VPNANGTELKQKAIAPKVYKKQSPKKQRLSKCAPKLPTQNLTKSDCTNRYKKQSQKTQVQTTTPPAATKGGVPQTVIGSAKPITTTQGGKEGKPGNGQ